MRKRVIDGPMEAESPAGDWLDLEKATAEVTSEDPQHPIEAALALDGPEAMGWRAAAPGPQTLRIVFDQPQRISRIYIEFVEREVSRSQEFTLAWSADHGKTFREIVRQQWNFSPDGAPTEIGQYNVDLHPVTVLQLQIDPDRSGGGARASLARLRVA